jgi:hypothetical protein
VASLVRIITALLRKSVNSPDPVYTSYLYVCKDGAGIGQWIVRLVKLGTKLRLSISIDLSRKGQWRPAKTLATQSGRTNKWLKDKFLISVKVLWMKINYPATAL